MKYIITLMVVTASWVTEPCELQKINPFYGCTVAHPKKLLIDTSLGYILREKATDIPRDTTYLNGSYVKYRVLKIDTLPKNIPFGQ